MNVTFKMMLTIIDTITKLFSDMQLLYRQEAVLLQWL